MDRICQVTDDELKELVAMAERAGTDEEVCPVETAYLIAERTLARTCGKGVMCRDGMRQVYLILKDFVDGRGKGEDDIEMLKEILGVIEEVADCDLSYTAVTTILSLMNNYSDEFDAHVKRKSCKKLICPGCHTVHIDAAKCQGSGACVKVCQFNAIKSKEGCFSVIDQSKCTSCNACISVCPNGAIKGAGAVKPQGPTEPAPVGSFGAGGGEGGGRRRRRG
ncbi:MAG: 4Fe-4S binding protein [Eubacterium sp.]|nr:4Fe-4S binding protein [Eubacterium sp.]